MNLASVWHFLCHLATVVVTTLVPIAPLASVGRNENHRAVARTTFHQDSAHELKLRVGAAEVDGHNRTLVYMEARVPPVIGLVGTRI